MDVANMNNFLRFYGQNEISPVSQNVADLGLHSGRRLALYRTLGLAPALFAGRDILEVAPGSGHNSIVTATLNARTYDLVEPNPTGFQNMLQLFDAHQLRTESTRFFNTRLEDFDEECRYDIVMCEGLVPGLSDQEHFLPQLAARVRRGGILILTCADAVSVFFESLRRYLARLLVRNVANESAGRDGQSQAVHLLLPAFAPHLQALKGMSRPPEDWIWDNLLNPAAANLAATHEFSVENCLNVLGTEFFFYGSSPVFMNDWSWYKNLSLTPTEYNKAFVSAFCSQRQNFLHYEETCAPDRNAGESMYHSCRNLSVIVEQRLASSWASIAPETVRQDLGHVKHVHEVAVSCGLLQSAAAIEEFLGLFADDRVPDARRIAEMSSFRGAFGRGQQYVSLVRA
jgi:2-polyprenyl-3-methyl-5-hydroxy-6-metoxy-1,4-benzoquinol methylase